MKKRDKEVKKKSWNSTKNQRGSRKEGTSTLTSMNVSRSILDISIIESVKTNGLELIVTDNGSETLVTTGITSLATTG